jgi:7-cyano-7-deazaguanine reductase
MHSDPSGLKALGTDTKYRFDGPHAALLESFPNPAHTVDLSVAGSSLNVHIEAPEFTSLCPLTGQPDFATIVIDYMPNTVCVESKALKLYLGSFRMAGEFHEACVQRIGRDLVALLDPIRLQVEGRFTPRGGIPFWPTFNYHKPAPPFPGAGSYEWQAGHNQVGGRLGETVSVTKSGD